MQYTTSSPSSSYSRYQSPGGIYRPPYKGSAPTTGHYHRYRRTPRPPRERGAENGE